MLWSVLCIVGGLAASLASTNQMPEAPPIVVTIKVCLQTLPNVPLRGKNSPIENHCYMTMKLIFDCGRMYASKWQPPQSFKLENTSLNGILILNMWRELVSLLEKSPNIPYLDLLPSHLLPSLTYQPKNNLFCISVHRESKAHSVT